MKKAEIFLRIACWAVLLFLAVKLVVYHVTLVAYPFPNEYREGAMMTTTQGLVAGVNPFALENQPQYMNDYGILYSLVTYPFAKIFGVTMLVHRIVTAFFILACCVLIGWVMRRLGTDWLLNALACVFLYAFLLYPTTTTPLVNPSALGLFIFLLALFVPWACRFSYASLLLSAVLGLLGYYTKPYFALSVPMIAGYLFLFGSKRKSFAFAGMFTVLTALSVAVVHRLAECYFANCFFLHLNPGHLSWGQSVRQFKEFVYLNRFVLGALFVVLAVDLYEARARWGAWFRRPGITANGAVRQDDKPFSYMFYCGLCCLVVLFFWLGKHEEAYLWYYFHLMSPFLLIGTAVAVSRKLPWALLFVPFLLWNIWSVTRLHDSVKFDFNDQNWKKIEVLISTHKDIINSPIVAPLLIQHGRPVYDNGLSEYVRKGSYRDTELSRWISKGDARMILRYYGFMNQMRERIANKEFHLGLLTYNYAPMVPGELAQSYRTVGAISLKTPAILGEWMVTVWVPNDR